MIALFNLATQNVTATNRTDVNVIATLTNCAGQQLKYGDQASNLLTLALVTSTAYSGTSTLRSACPATVARRSLTGEDEGCSGGEAENNS